MAGGVEFEEDNFGKKPASSPGFSSNTPHFSNYGQPAVSSNVPKMIQWLMRKGVVKSESAGQWILVVIILLNFAIAYFVYKIFL